MYIFVVLLFIIIVTAILIAKYYYIKTISGARETRIKDLVKAPRSKSEQRVIDIFEKHTGKKFPTVLPKWLVYKGKQLELDGYCEELAIAVEFSGPLHTKWFPNKESRTRYLERIKKDEAKISICKKNGVRLFVIDMRIPPHQLHQYVKSRLYDVGIVPMPPNYIPEMLFEPDPTY